MLPSNDLFLFIYLHQVDMIAAASKFEALKGHAHRQTLVFKRVFAERKLVDPHFALHAVF
jgi:hypothetical protein